MANPAIREARPTQRDEEIDRAEEMLGVRPPLTISKALKATEGASDDPDEVEGRLNKAKARLAQLNESVETAREDLREAREQLVEAEKAGDDAAIEQAEEDFQQAKSRLERKEETLDDRAEALRDAVESLRVDLMHAKVREQAKKAKRLNEEAQQKAEQMKDALDDLRSLNTEIAELQEEAHLTHLDADFDELHVLSATGRPGGLDTPPLFFEALDEEGERHHLLRSLDSVEAFLENVEEAK